MMTSSHRAIASRAIVCITPSQPPHPITPPHHPSRQHACAAHVQRASLVPVAEVIESVVQPGDLQSFEDGGKDAGYDPMEGDTFDPDEVQNRRCEEIATAHFGNIFARCTGDPADR